jgi:NTP pyrophosphatase (non-canonical NTP hydrolase)
MRQCDSLDVLRDRLREFARQRDWERYHTPKNLSAALVAEAGELVAVLQWAHAEADLTPYLEELTDEVADVLIYLVRFCDVAGIDLVDAASKKVERNGLRFPTTGPAGA